MGEGVLGAVVDSIRLDRYRHTDTGTLGLVKYGVLPTSV